ncbi:TPA: helix-turn-helix domain-containing protein [Providencia rettgeri]
MSTHLLFSTPVETQENNYISNDYESALALVRKSVMDGVMPLGDSKIDISLISMDGETLWLSNRDRGDFEITRLLLADMSDSAQLKLFVSPIELNGTFYFLAPVYLHDGELFLIIAVSTAETNSNVLFALTQSLAREASGNLKCQYYQQRLSCEDKYNQRFANLDIQSVEKELIIEVAQTCKGKVQKMHQVLNMGRTTLWRKLKQYEINIKEYK